MYDVVIEAALHGYQGEVQTEKAGLSRDDVMEVSV